MTDMRDPKGYYVALGIDENADADAIKAAYRAKAKRVHPDFNPSPVATKQFHRLHEAYETLSDPELRAAYDKPWRNATEPPKTSSGFGWSAKTKADPKPEPQKPKAKPQSETRSSASNFSSASTLNVEQPSVCQCGRVTAQPRHLVFDMVLGQLNRVVHRRISGVFCRSCADRTAVRASLVTWIAGWWAWPEGPRETVKALINNIRGGRRSPERNARLLMTQSRAFRARGEMELARSAAEQALNFATTQSLRREVDQLLVSLSSHPARALKDRWANPGWAPVVQVLPLALIVGVLSMTATMYSPRSLTTTMKSWVASAERLFQRDAVPAAAGKSNSVVGRVYSVLADTASLRTGPGAGYQLVALAPRGTLLLVVESDPTGQWLRVTTADGTAGFVSANQVSPDVRIDALKDMGGFGKLPPE